MALPTLAARSGVAAARSASLRMPMRTVGAALANNSRRSMTTFQERYVNHERDAVNDRAVLVSFRGVDSLKTGSSAGPLAQSGRAQELLKDDMSRCSRRREHEGNRVLFVSHSCVFED